MEDETLTVAMEAELDTSEMSRIIGNNLIIGGNDNRPFAYLAGIAFDGMNSDDDLVDILMEYIRNESSLNLREGEEEQIESLLRTAHEE